MIQELVSEFAGLPVVEFNDEGVFREGERLDAPPADVAWRVRVLEDEGSFGAVFEKFLETVDPSSVTALIIGWWQDYGGNGAFDDPVERLLEASDSLTGLRSLFLGDVVVEEREVSWIPPLGFTPLFEAYPRLERFWMRSGEILDPPRRPWRPFRAEHLRELRLESGGLPAAMVRAVAGSDLPALEHLELWLGMRHYGGDATVEDLAPILSGERLPSLRHLGLQDAEIQDEICAAVASAPIVARLESLALSMGVLTDAGAEALLSGQPLTHLRSLDLHHNYLSEEMTERIRKALPGVEIDLSGRQRNDGGWLFVEVAE
ncbi:STM4015 family protein [Thermomonospora catenispora]|uniref:STM4015 family protein n=1 Tax=Thermomonospora catenispora TaxID=2493090 RepID=UPI00111DB14C|nr:STM4015 family protein [Thermomonospora catenispora]TNY34647.1 leucine-rich repeat domain-containing protein [Thermomonospora catenispora]